MEKTIITIGREYGSGGHEIGRAVADRLGIPFYDKEILTRAAKESGICEELFVHHDEKTSPSYLFSLVAGMNVDAQSYSTDLPLNHRIFMAQFDAIGKLASESSCVIVGRCADYVLKNQPGVTRVFFYADVESRIERIMGVEKVDHDKAKELVRKMDKQRQSYYNFFADGNWGHRSNYDLMLNTSGLTHEAAAAVVVAYLEGHHHK
ncbi:MAG: cytidylate kinase-like family protein [Eubacteriales bacterium]|nr:cytidylate kinase-like family protein [Eubacteriales bacterium]